MEDEPGYVTSLGPVPAEQHSTPNGPDLVIGSEELVSSDSEGEDSDPLFLKLPYIDKSPSFSPRAGRERQGSRKSLAAEPLADYGDDDEELNSIIRLFRSHWKQKWAHEYRERLLEYKDYEKRMIHLRKHLSVLKNMVQKAKKKPQVDLKQDLYGLKILTDNRVMEPLDITKLKKKPLDPKGFIPDIPNKMLDGGLELPDDMKDIISMQVKDQETELVPPKPYSHPRNLIKNYTTAPDTVDAHALPHLQSHVDLNTQKWTPGEIYKVPGINRYYDNWDQLCARQVYRPVKYQYGDYTIKGQLKQFMQYNTQRHSTYPNANHCMQKTKRWPVIYSSWLPSEAKQPWMNHPEISQRSARFTNRTSRSARHKKMAKIKKKDKENPEVQYRRTPGGSIVQFLQRCQTDHVFSEPRKTWDAKHMRQAYSVI